MYEISLECPICLDPIEVKIEDEKLMPIDLKCKHIFHKSCIQEWLRINPSCPYCRQFVENGKVFSIVYNYDLNSKTIDLYNCSLFSSQVNTCVLSVAMKMLCGVFRIFDCRNEY